MDFVKLDCCYQDNVADRNTAYISMSQALSAAPYPILFSCDTDELINKDNNVEFPYAWAPPYCNMARIWWDGEQYETHEGRTVNVIIGSQSVSCSTYASRPFTHGACQVGMLGSLH